jgi:ABC-type multidrug transport system ATPase subunit
LNIILQNIGKRYNYEWIFRKVDLDLQHQTNYVILGANGSGKSTLLQIIAGNLLPSEGKLVYSSQENKSIDPENIYTSLSFAAPYLELFEDYTLIESIELQSRFKPFHPGLDVLKIIDLMELGKAKDKQLKFYSSGMKQRVKLALAILAETPLLLLDEPTSNLDRNAISWYQQLVKNYSSGRTIIVASNQLEHEYVFCEKELRVEDYK